MIEKGKSYTFSVYVLQIEQVISFQSNCLILFSNLSLGYLSCRWHVYFMVTK